MTVAVCRAQKTATVALVGPPGSGVRTVIASASDIDGLPHGSGVRPSLHIGRLDIGDELVVRLLAAAPDRLHGHLWPALAADAIGVVVVVDGADIGSGFSTLDGIERSQMPYGVIVNRIDGRLDHTIAELRAAMDLDDRVVLTEADGRDRVSAQMAVLAVLDGLFGWS